jgi:hypothetical protein
VEERGSYVGVVGEGEEDKGVNEGWMSRERFSGLLALLWPKVQTYEFCEFQNSYI